MSFQKGQSGNPAGRKPGTKNRKIELLRSNDKRLQKKVLKMALDGDPVALRICADRLWPKIRPEALPVRVTTTSSDLASQGAAIIDAALSGKLTPDVLRDLLSALADQARLIEFTEIEARLQALEGQEPVAPWEQPSKDKLPIRGRKRRLSDERKLQKST